MFDCIIVGAGPAGTTVAYHLAKRGRSVLVLEKANLPRYKPCSGAVSPSVAQWFDFDFAPAIDRKVNQVRYTWKLGDPIDAKLETSEPIWMVKRDVFDHFLVKQAQAQGAEVRDGVAVMGVEFKGDRWVVQTSEGIQEAKFLVGADGAKGKMAEWLGFKEPKLRQVGILEVKAPAAVSENDAINFEFGLVKNGCLWNFPKSDGFSIGAGTFLGSSLKEFRSSIEKYLPEFGVTYDQGTEYVDSLKLWDGNRPLHTLNAVIVGEAAAVVDPLTAEGIRPSIYSGVKAAEALDQAIAGSPDALQGYTDVMHQEWGADMQWAQRIAGIFYRMPGVGYRVGIKRPTATKRLGQLLAGDIHYADIAGRVLKRLSGSLIPGMRG
ncbi:MAG: geranylgeranyl reductase family protein [Leptolyngbya sp. SIO4C5]|uniref:geranylgeranyl reductase family protein n=1 Tax=Sphaerothrix gracilis TaxID=3151835 RepID=UPI0013BFA8E8|nr:geranylgeranyl reductase family protein [Leptolyngbya sp. SIO4C5]